MLKRSLYVLMSLVLFLTFVLYIPADWTYGADNPGTPNVSLKALEGDSGIKVVIGKTANADGYRIYIKSPDASKFKSAKTIKKSGKAERTYTIKNLKAGTYEIRVKAYKVNNGKKTWGKYGKTVSITLKGTDVKNGSDSDLMVERALKKLKMPDEKKTKLDSTITFSEYTEILSNIISEYRPKLATKWKKIVSAASKSKEKMMLKMDILCCLIYGFSAVTTTDTDSIFDGGNDGQERLMRKEVSKWSI